MSDSTVTYPLLIFATQDSTAVEIRQAVRESVDQTVISFEATDLTKAVDIVRDREPKAALVELTGNPADDMNRIGELRSIQPQLVIVGIYSGESANASLGSAEMVSLVRSGVSDFIRRPIADVELNDLFDRLIPEQGQLALPSSIGTCVALISNKGGVGKSTTSVNLGVSLAKRYPNEVLLVDASLQMGVCAPMLNLTPETSLLDAFEQRHRLDGTLIRQLATWHESGLLLLAAPSDPIAAADIDDQAMSRVLNLARRTFRFVIVDTFPLFDQTIMSVLDIADRAYIVIDNVVPTVLSGVQLMGLLESLNYPMDRIGVIVNRFQRLAGNPLLEDVANSLRKEIDHVIPYDKRVITAANVGRPHSMDFLKWSKLHQATRDLVNEVERLNQGEGAEL